MEGNIVAIGLLVTIAVTAFALIRRRRRPFPWYLAIAGFIVYATGVVTFLPVFTTHLTPPPWQVFCITSLCTVSVIFLGVSSTWRYYTLIGFTLAMQIGLMGYTMHLLHGGDYTCISRPYEWSLTYLSKTLEALSREDKQSYPAGWLSDQPFATQLSINHTWGYRFIPHPTWHNWLTGLYRRETQRVAAWYPGGRLSDVYMKIEFRPRTEE